MTIPLILVSASPRRRQMLARLGLPYTVAISPVDEDAVQERYAGPSEGLAQWLAEQKAISALTLPEAEHALVITADTTVILDGMVLGKPCDTTHAHELLLSLRGRWHHVVTGISVAHLHNAQPELRSASCTTPVLMTARINGCYLNVVGLPLCVLVRLLAEFDVQPGTAGRQHGGCLWSERCRI